MIIYYRKIEKKKRCERERNQPFLQSRRGPCGRGESGSINQSLASKVKRWYSYSQGGPGAIHRTWAVRSMMIEALVCH